MEGCCESQSKHIKRAGDYLLGLVLPKNSLKALTNCIARKDKTDYFRVLRIVNLESDDVVTGEDIQKAKNAILKEAFLLSLLEGERGILRHYGLYKDVAVDDEGNPYPRVVSVVDCYVPHDFSPNYTSFTNLYFYMKEKKRISEDEAIRLLVECLRILSRVHDMNIVHRDLTLSNFVLNTTTGQMQLVNFGQGALLVHPNELLPVQPGSPLYFSPEIVAARPYLGKPTDIWSMGVIFYSLLFTEFPFYACDLGTLYQNISKVSFKFPINKTASAKSINIINRIFVRNPQERLTCQQLLDELLTVPLSCGPSLQVVPDSIELEDVQSCIAPKPKQRIRFTRDNHGEIPLKTGQVMKYRQMLFNRPNTVITAS